MHCVWRVAVCVCSTKDVDDSLRWIYRFLPGYCLGEGLVVLAMRTVLKFVFPDRNNTALHWDTTGKPLLYLAMHAVLLTCAAMAVDFVLSNPSWRAKVLKDPVVPEATHDEDSDVVAEATPNPDDAVRLTNIRKVYGSHNPCTSTKPKVAVRSLSFGVRKGECFGTRGGGMELCCVRGCGLFSRGVWCVYVWVCTARCRLPGHQRCWQDVDTEDLVW